LQHLLHFRTRRDQLHSLFFCVRFCFLGPL
jgi:hypothetical protein